MENQKNALWIKLELLIHRLQDKPSIMHGKKLDYEGGMDIKEINRLSNRNIFRVEEKDGETFLVISHPDLPEELAERWCVRSQPGGWNSVNDHPRLNPDKLQRTIDHLRAWQAESTQEGFPGRVSTGQPTTVKDDGRMGKSKTEVWGEDADGNFTINGKKATKKQKRQLCSELKFDIPENYRDLLPELEKRVQNLAHCRVPKDPFDGPFRNFVQAVTKRLLPEDVLRAVGPTSEPGFSRFTWFMRLVVLQAKWEGISPQQVIDEALGRTKTSESTGVGDKITDIEGNPKHPTLPDVTTKSDTRRNYMRIDEAERIATEKFKDLWRIDNKSEWAREIGCNRHMVGNLDAWRRADKRRQGFKKLETRLKRTFDSETLEAICSSDPSKLKRLSNEDREKLDAMLDNGNEDLLDLVEEQIRDDNS